MKKLTLALLLIISTTIISAQNVESLSDTRFSNSLNVSISGNASILSVSYERFVTLSDNGFLAFSAGIGYTEDVKYKESFCIFCPTRRAINIEGRLTTIPFNVTYNMGRDRHFFEFGLGAAFIRKDGYKDYLMYPKMGYRFIRDRFNLKIIAILNSKDQGVGDVLPLQGGVNLGFVF